MVEISCIMSNYNTDSIVLKTAIESILKQTFQNFEFIIIDDGSTDIKSKAILQYYEQNDKIRVIYNKENIGLTRSLNIAIQSSRGKYIARMDSDDISHKDRFFIQYKYMEKHKYIDICGSYVKYFGDVGGIGMTPFFSNEYVSSQLFLSNCLLHPTVMIRKSFLDMNRILYNEEYIYSQDYELWCRCAQIGKIEIINKVLLNYRVHNKQISNAKRNTQQELKEIICREQLNLLLGEYREYDFEIHKILCKLSPFHMSEFVNLKNWVKYLIKINRKNKVFDENCFKTILYNRLFIVVIKSKNSIFEKMFLIIKNPVLWKLNNYYTLMYRFLYFLGVR